MTVCVAAICRWNYGKEGKIDYGQAVVIASDRMMTSGDTEYEPPKQKMGHLAKNAIVMVAGDFTVHSQVVAMAAARIKSSNINRINEIAEGYAESLREFKAKQASDIYLEPLGITLESFRSGHARLPEELTYRIAEQLQGYSVDAEAIIAGCDDAAHIYGQSRWNRIMPR